MLLDESVLTLSEAARALPPLDGKRPHSSTIWRWARKGLRGIKLEVRRIGGRFVTSREALERFSQRLAEIPLNDEPPTRTPANSTSRGRTDKQRLKDIEAAERTLRDGGVL